MRIPFRPLRDYSIDPLAVEDARAIARLHREDFERPWTGDEFASLLDQPTVFGFMARETGRGSEPPLGFVLARLAAGEGEILTIAVSRAHRRRGLGWRLMAAVLGELHGQRAEALLLEVDETNAAAVALYRRLGFREVGRRPHYYASSGGSSGALVMKRDLGRASEAEG